MKLFKSLIVAPATLGLLTPFSVSANEVNLKDISNYSDVENIELANSFKKEEPTQSLLLAGGEGLVDSHSHDGGFSTTTSASFGADFVIGQVSGSLSKAASKESTTFNYQYGMNLSTSFTGEDSLDLTIETGNAGGTSAATILDMNDMSDSMTLDGITYTFPLGDAVTVMVGDSTDVSALYSTACTYSAFTDLLSNCGSATAAGLGGGTNGAKTASSATAAASYDFGNGLTIAGGLSGAGGDKEGIFTKESLDVYGIQAAYNTDSYGVSVSYALTETSSTADTSFVGINAFYALDNGLSVSVGYEEEDPDSAVEETGYFVGLTYDDFGPGSLSVGMSTLENYTDAQTEAYQYEAAYSYPVNDGMTITPGFFVKEVANADDETGIIVKTSFSF